MTNRIYQVCIHYHNGHRCRYAVIVGREDGQHRRYHDATDSSLRRLDRLVAHSDLHVTFVVGHGAPSIFIRRQTD